MGSFKKILTEEEDMGILQDEQIEEADMPKEDWDDLGEMSDGTKYKDIMDLS